MSEVELVNRLKLWARQSDRDYALKVEIITAIERLVKEVERLNLSLAACGVGAMANTEASKQQRIDKDNPCWCASVGDVYAAVDREMAHRTRAEAAEAQVAALRERYETAAYDVQPAGTFQKLNEQVAALREALEPFSKAYDRVLQLQSEHGASDEASTGLGIKFKHVKAARKALEEAPQCAT